jgi:hypothetical protein
MESRAARGFRISSQTAPLVIAALRHYADLALGTPSAYHVERWDRLGQHVEEVVATTGLILVGKAAFRPAVEQYPGTRITLRQGIRVFEQAG